MTIAPIAALAIIGLALGIAAWLRHQSPAIVAAYVMAGIVPLIGIGFGIYLLVKGRAVHGLGSIILAFLTMSFWYFFLIMPLPCCQPPADLRPLPPMSK
jgi:hypothetical protein